MQTFISETLDKLCKQHSDFKHVVFIFPSQRAAVFTKNELRHRITKGFLPELLTIEDLIEKISGLQKEETIRLLFELYACYTSIEKNPVAFHHFSSWAFTVLQDFNEIDQYLVTTNELFSYLRDVQRLKKWSVKGTFKETDLIKDHYAFMETLDALYTTFYAQLKQQQKGYQGLLYREAVLQCDRYLEQHPTKTYVFIGFNALNKAEETLFQRFLSNGNTQVFWDIDTTFLKGNHIAGKFIRSYAQDWPYYQKYPLETVSDSFAAKKHIEVIGVPKNVTQLKFAGELLAPLEGQETAFVLGDESLLTVALHSLPEKKQPINITMGYPLKDVPTTHLIQQLFQLHLGQKSLQKDLDTYYHKDVLRLLGNEITSRFIAQEDASLCTTLSQHIVQENLMFVSNTMLQKLSAEASAKSQHFIALLFQSVATTSTFLTKVINIMEILQEDAAILEREHLFRMYTLCSQLVALDQQHHYFEDLSTVRNFFNQLIRSENLSFKGEPLKGLQIMGMLETRGLDFENLIITSVNEGVMPGNSSTTSFIPFDAKLEFGLPTYREKDAIYAYHFYRLLQRAKRCYLLYNSDTNGFGTSEQSRFITQLKLMKDDIVERQVNSKTATIDDTPIRIDKTQSIITSLEQFVTNGISPSAIATYLSDPIRFYKQYVLGIKETELLEETVAANTMGSVIHDTLEALYLPYIGKILQVSDVDAMQQLAPSYVIQYFTKHFKGGDLKTGKNKLIFEVVKTYIERFLNTESTFVSKHRLEIVATEQRLRCTLQIPGITVPVTLKGTVDRVDLVDGNTLRIIDYKTGIVEKSKLSIPNLHDINDAAYAKAIQLLLYAYLYLENTPVHEQTTVIAGIFAIKKSTEGLLQLNFSEHARKYDYAITPDRRLDFITALQKIIVELFDLSIAFEAPEEVIY